MNRKISHAKSAAEQVKYPSILAATGRILASCTFVPMRGAIYPKRLAATHSSRMFQTPESSLAAPYRPVKASQTQSNPVKLKIPLPSNH